MTAFDLEGVPVEVQAGDSVASAMYRAGVRTFTRSIKYHRRRGLYCVSGDCPNCLVTVDGVPGCRACVTPAAGVRSVRRETGWPSTEHDVLRVLDRMHRLLPVGFYYKAFIRPRFAWAVAERVIRRATGVGRLPDAGGAPDHPRPTRHVRCDVLVVGGGLAGLSAAEAAAAHGERVIVADEGSVGEKIADPALRERVRALADDLRSRPNVDVLERWTAVGVYEGPLVPLVGPDATWEVEPGRVVVATGAVERHAVFPGNDLPGVFLGRGAARLALVHGVAPARRAVVVATTTEGLEIAGALEASGVEVVARIGLGVADPAPAAGSTGPIEMSGAASTLVRAVGRGRVRGAVVRDASGRSRHVACDAIVVSVGYAPRDGLLRMAHDLPVQGAGDVAAPGCSADEAAGSGREAGLGRPVSAHPPTEPASGDAGSVCLCEDVSLGDLRRAWREGFDSSEILKRYTTATMGPCQGAMCGLELARFVAGAAGDRAGTAAGGRDAAADPTLPHGTSTPGRPSGADRTTARPPARPVRLGDLVGSVHEAIERRTALHDRHLELGASLQRSGSWARPSRYGDVLAEHAAVREGVSIMDVSTLGKFLVAGTDAAHLLDLVLPCRILDLGPGRSRYFVALDEAGYAIDDGLVSADDPRRFFVTSTSGGADRMEAWLRDWIDRSSMRAYIVNQTAMLGAINVAGPASRELLARLCGADLSSGAIAYPGQADATVAGVPCRVLRVGFVGELSFELHHPRSRSVELWDRLLAAGADMGIRPHGLDALDLLRLEKGHVYLGQDTLPDDHPGKLGLGFTVAMDKGPFVGRTSFERMIAAPIERRLVGLAFGDAPSRGMPLSWGDEIVGRVTSCATSPTAGPIGLGWVRGPDGAFPTDLRAGGIPARVVPTPFYDPEGVRVRA